VVGYLGISMMERLVVPQILVIDRSGVVRAQSEPTGSAELQDGAKLRELISPMLGKR
jgi:hypothetical protein